MMIECTKITKETPVKTKQTTISLLISALLICSVPVIQAMYPTSSNPLVAQDGTKKSIATMSAGFASALLGLVPSIKSNTLTIGMIEKILQTRKPGKAIVYEDTSLLWGFCSEQKKALFDNADTVLAKKDASFADIESAAAGLGLIQKADNSDALAAKKQLRNLVTTHLKTLRDTVQLGTSKSAGELERTTARKALTLLKQASHMFEYNCIYEKALDAACTPEDLLDEVHKQLSNQIKNGTLIFDTTEKHMEENERLPEDMCCMLGWINLDLIFEQARDLHEKHAPEPSEIEHVYTALGFVKGNRTILNDAILWQKKVLKQHAHRIKTFIAMTANKLPEPVVARAEESLLSEVRQALTMLEILDDQKDDALANTWDDLFPNASFTLLQVKLALALSSPEAPQGMTPNPIAKSFEKEPEPRIDDKKDKGTEPLKANLEQKVHATTTWNVDRRKLGVALKWAASLAGAAALVAGVLYYYKKQHTKPGAVKAG